MSVIKKPDLTDPKLRAKLAKGMGHNYYGEPAWPNDLLYVFPVCICSIYSIGWRGGRNVFTGSCGWSCSKRCLGWCTNGIIVFLFGFWGRFRSGSSCRCCGGCWLQWTVGFNIDWIPRWTKETGFNGGWCFEHGGCHVVW